VPTLPIRLATLSDAGIIASHRRKMFSDMGERNESALDAMCSAFLPWVERKISGGEYLGWLITNADGEVVAGAGLWLMDWPPHMIGSATRGNILNVYVERAFRRQGLARRLMETALEWCRANGVRAVILHASEEGRGLYTRMGFRPTNEMRVVL
jgi:GNAT superfamily N-acetyltransferase